MIPGQSAGNGGCADGIASIYLANAIQAIANVLPSVESGKGLSKLSPDGILKYQELLSALVTSQAIEACASNIDSSIGDLAGCFAGVGSISTSLAALADNLDKVAAEMYAANRGKGA